MRTSSADIPPLSIASLIISCSLIRLLRNACTYCWRCPLSPELLLELELEYDPGHLALEEELELELELLEKGPRKGPPLEELASYSWSKGPLNLEERKEPAEDALDPGTPIRDI